VDEMEIDYKQLGNRISKERKKNNLTQEQLAEKIGMSVNHISNIENDYSIPSLETFIKICLALDVTPDTLLVGTVYALETYMTDELIDRLNKCNDKEKRLISKFIDWIFEERKQ
jgi:Predicted transcriptional regulators